VNAEELQVCYMKLLGENFPVVTTIGIVTSKTRCNNIVGRSWPVELK